MFYDSLSDSAVLQAFRQQSSPETSVTLGLKGINGDGYYSVRDVDGLRSISRIKGSDLKKDLTVAADSPRTSVILYIEGMK